LESSNCGILKGMIEIMKTRLVFVRHAEAEGNLIRQFHGWTNSEITEKGHVQAQLVAERLKNEKIDVIYSSSLKRTMQTAQYIADIKGLPIKTSDKLKEIFGGDWEGKRWDELPGIWPYENDTWENKPHLHVMPNGESMADFQKRLIEEVDRIIDNNEGRNICIVTHGTAIRTLMCHFFGCDLDHMLKVKWYDNTAVTILEHEKGTFNVLTEGNADHLTRELSTLHNQEWWAIYEQEFEKKTGDK